MAPRVKLVLSVPQPDELEALFARQPDARERFERLSLVQQRFYIDWIRAARLPRIRYGRAGLLGRALAAA